LIFLCLFVLEFRAEDRQADKRRAANGNDSLPEGGPLAFTDGAVSEGRKLLYRLTVESYTVLSANSHTYCYMYLAFHHPLALSLSGLKPSFSTNLSHCSPSFLLLKYLLRGFPGLFTVISEHICFLLLVFFCFYTF